MTPSSQRDQKRAKRTAATFNRDDLTLIQAFYQADKELTVGMVQGAIQSFETLIDNKIERGTKIYEALDSSDRRTARRFVDLGGAMGAILAQAMNVMATTGTPKRSDHGSGIVGQVGYVEDLREFSSTLKFLGDETAENVRIFNRAVDT